MPPNILIIVFDTARADAFEPYGAPSGTTPAVAELARRGSALPAMFSTANWTLPSHASMFSGLLPRSMGLGSAMPTRANMERYEDRLLPAVLRRAGYSTSGVSANVFITRRFGFDIGFDRFHSVVGTRRHSPAAGLRPRLRWSIDAVRARIDDGLAAADEIVRTWLADGPGPPFFWFVNLMECHSPYLPPRPWNDLGILERYRAGVDALRYQSHEGLVRVSLGDLDMPAASVKRMRHLYRRAVTSMDDWVGRIVEELERRAMLDDTLVIVTSDHGENIGESHLIGHGFSLDDRLIRVPFVAAGPGAPTGTQTRSLAHVPEMIARATGLANPPWGPLPVPDGTAVAQTDQFGMLAPEAAEQLLEAWRIPPEARRHMLVRRSAATDGRFKLVRTGDEERLYDLSSDPMETVDVTEAHPDQASRLRGILEEAEPAAPVPEPAATGTDGVDDREQAEIEERMRLLGYL